MKIPIGENPETIKSFISALQDNDHKHVADVFKENSSEHLLSDERYEVLKSKATGLRKCLDPECGILERRDVFSSSDKENVESIQRGNKKVSKILEIISRKTNAQFDKFIEALKEESQGHVADVLIHKSSEHLMSDARRELLKAKSADLKKYLDPECGILDQLECRGPFSLSDKETVESSRPWNKQIDNIVKILSRKTNSDFDQFIDCLTEVSQEHVVYILTGAGSPPMNDETLELLTTKRKAIVDNMDSVHTPLLSTLVSMKVFTKFDKQRVEAEDEIRWRRNERILDILERKPQHVFGCFLQSLRETYQEHVVHLLTGAELHAVVRVETTNSEPVDKTTEQNFREVIREDLKGGERDDDNTIVKTLDDVGVKVTDVYKGSIKIKFSLFSEESLELFRNLLSKRELDRLFTERYCHCPRFVHSMLKSLRVDVADEEFERCSIEMARLALMSAEHREALEQAKEAIADKIEVNEDLLKLLSLCKHRTEAILGSKDKAQVLLDVMIRRPDLEFQELVNALRDTGQTEAVKFLTGFYVSFLLAA